MPNLSLQPGASIRVQQGASPSIAATLRDRAGNVINLTGWSVKFAAKRLITDVDSKKIFDVVCTVNDPLNGGILIPFSGSMLAAVGTLFGSIRMWPAPATAPTVALAGAGAGNVDNGTHYYTVSFVMGQFESIDGPVSSVVSVADKTVNGKVNVTAIPLGPTGTTARNVYRTLAGTASNTAKKLVGTISDNTTTTLLDNIADGSLGKAGLDTLANLQPYDAYAITLIVDPGVINLET